MMDDCELAWRIAFSSVRGMTPALASDLIQRLGSERAFFDASESQLRYISQSRSRIYAKDYRDQLLAKARAEVAFIRKNDVTTLYHTDPGYPPTLALCDDAPLMLYGLGATDLASSRMIGIVGTRHATAYGIDFTNRIVEQLAETVDNLVIVSGLAYGIDVVAHRAALRCGIPTVAVLAHGLHTIYPADHRSTAVDIIRKGGMLLCDYRSDEPVHKGNFVARNRIVAGMSHCLLVVESAEKGGALITARLAHAYGRDVFAVPGRVGDQFSAGCNRIISSGEAMLVSSAADICEAMNWPQKEAITAQPSLPMALNPDEELIVNFLRENDNATLSQITASTGMPIGKLMSLLIDMEFRGLALSLPGGHYRLTLNS